MCGICQRADRIQKLDHRTGPAVREDNREWPRTTAPHMVVVDIEIFHASHELRVSVQPGFRLAPVEPRGPITGEFLHVIPVDSVLPSAGEPVGPTRFANARQNAVDGVLWNRDVEWTRASGWCVGR